MATKESDEPNTLYYGDNLDILKRYVDDESVDLVYLDPPIVPEYSGPPGSLAYRNEDFDRIVGAGQLTAFRRSLAFVKCHSGFSQLVPAKPFDP